MNSILENLETVQALCEAIVRKYELNGDCKIVAKSAALGSMQGFVALALMESPVVREALNNRLQELGLEPIAV